MANIEFVNSIQNLKFTRAFRRQIYTIDLAAILLIHIKQDQLHDTEPIKRAKNAMISAFKAINPHFPKIPVSAKDERRFKRHELKIRKIISGCVINDKEITHDLVNAIFVLAEKAKEEALKGQNQKLIQAWDDFIENMLYTFAQLDHNLSDEKWCKLGDALVGKLEKAIEIA